MTEPTDNDLDALILQHWPAAATATLPLRWIRAAFREGLAKWGTPPITYMRPSPTLGVAPFGPGTSAALTTPTQAQAGAVPLTEQQINEMWYDQWDGFVSFAEAEVIVRATEEAHGIKGGQHGADEAGT